METMPKIITIFAVTIMPQRQQVRIWLCTILVKVMAKETLDQLVATVVIDVEVW